MWVAPLQGGVAGLQSGLAPLQSRFTILFHVRAMVREAFTLSHCGLVCFRYFAVGRFFVACAVRVGHGVAAEVFEVLLHLFHEVDGFVAVGVEPSVGVGHHHEGGVGFVALIAGGFEFAQLLLGILVVAFGDEGRNFSINADLLWKCLVLVKFASNILK